MLAIRFVLALALALTTLSPSSAADHVVLISIDGLRPDAITSEAAPTLQRLIKLGTYCPNAKTLNRSLTLPSHTSMLTGLRIERHGITWNRYREGHLKSPTALALAKAAGRTTGAWIAKRKLRYLLAPESVDEIYGPSGARIGPEPDTSASGIATAFAASWKLRRFAFSFIHLREPDSAGHEHGWLSPGYMAAVTASDSAVATIWSAIQDSPAKAKTVVILTSDHGGHGTMHGSSLPVDTTIPWLCVGADTPVGKRIDRVVHTYDTAPTVLALLGVAVPANLDGKTVREVLNKP